MDEEEPLPSAPHIGTLKSASVDKTIRQYFDATEEVARETGNPHAKVTNIKDNLREGDVAAIVPQPSQEYKSLVAQATGGEYSPWQQIGVGDVSAALQGARNGRMRDTGAKALKAIQGGRGGLPMPSGGIKGSFGGGVG